MSASGRTSSDWDVRAVQVALNALVSKAKHIMSNATDFFSCLVLAGVATSRKKRPDGRHAFVKDRLWDVVRLLSTSKILRVWRWWIKLDTRLSNQIPSSFQVFSGTGKLEIVHIHGEHQSKRVVSPHTFPAGDKSKTNALEAGTALSFPEDACERMSVKR